MSPYTPSPIVEVAFGFGPYDEVGEDDWTDISEDVYEVSIQRGRNSEFEGFPASTATVSLYNDSRVYDPLNLAGPYVESAPNDKIPYIVTQSTKSGTSLGASNSMNMPTGIIAGELLVAVASENLGTTSLTADVAWTQIIQLQHISGGSAVRSAIFAKIAAGSDTLSLSGGSEDFACVVMRIAQHSVTTLASDITKASLSTSGSASLVSATVSIPEAERPYLVLAAAGCNDDNETTPWAPSGATEVVLIESAQSASSTMLMVFSREVEVEEGTITTSPGNFAVSASTTAAALTIAIPGPTETRTQLQPNIPIRVMADLAADGVFPVWRGVVDGWPGIYSEGGFRNEVEISATDVFRVFAERDLPNTLIQEVEAILEPYAWFRGELSPYEQLVDRQGNSLNASLGSNASVGEGISPASDKSIEFPSVSNSQTYPGAILPIAKGAILVNQINDDLLAGTRWAFSCLYKADGLGVAGTIRPWHTVTPTGSIVYTIAAISANGTISASADGVGATVQASALTTSLNDARTHHILVIRSVTSLGIYIDGVLAAAGTDAGATSFYNQTGNIIAFGYAFGTTGVMPAFALAEVMFFPQLTSTQVTALIADAPDLYQALTTGFSTPRLTGEAINDVLDLIGWPASLRAIDDGELVVTPPGNPYSFTALELLQRLAESEQGRLFIDAEGKVTFHTRSRPLMDTAETDVQYTFSDSGSGVGTRDGSLQVTLDDRHVYDAATVTRVGGVEQRAQSIAKPVRTRTLDDLYLSTDAQALAIAEWIVFRYGRALVRTEAWEIDPETKATDWPDILGLEIGHRIQHDITPGGIGSSLELDQHIELIEHEITTEEWILTMNGSPVDNNDYFLWDTTESTSTMHGWNAGVWG